MADTKLSALVELAATPADADEVYIRDVSEAAADESKKITVANLMAAGSKLTVAETEVFAANTPAAAAWTDLDLSGTIGAKPSLVLLKFSGNLGANQTTGFRKNGDTSEIYVDAGCSSALHPDGASVHATYFVATDNAGVIEWKCGGLNRAVTIDIIAYIN